MNDRSPARPAADRLRSLLDDVPIGGTVEVPELDLRQVLAEYRLLRVIYDREHPQPDTCPKRGAHKPHRWLPPRSAVECPGRPATKAATP